jgi:tetratricopeptide (TPR) repeat protein
MTINATNSSKERMDCARVAREEIVENYLLGRLPEEDRVAFEEHYFECEPCFDELRTMRAAREELARAGVEADSRTHTFWGWKAVAGFATAAIIIIGVALSLREPSPAPRETTTATTSTQPQTTRTETQAPAAKTPAEPTLEQLARVEAFPYEPVPLRGPLDEATQRFRHGMERYRKADYRSAIDELRGARKLDPDAAHISFFLGVSQLMTGQDVAAIDSLRQTIALGDSPYLEEAHFYLAKAYLRRKDLDAAEAQLNQVIQLRGSEREEARRLLAQIERLKK